jgi:tryptophan-rich sensory protein
MIRGAMGRDWIVLAVFILVCFGAGAVGSWFTTPALDGWYAYLRKPVWNPPNWIFAPVWSTLYLLMAIAAWLVWRKSGFAASGGAMGLFAAQLVLNVVWSAVFFGLRSPAAALVEVTLLWLAIAATIWAFSRTSSVASWIMAPYLAWVTFATALNLAIWRLNS